MSSQDITNSIEIPLLTFNSLYNLLREERKTKSLQKLPEQFYEALEKFFENKKIEIKKLKENTEITDKLKKEKNILKNSQKISLSLLNLRCSKISNIAINNEFEGENVYTVENILEKEVDFFNTVQKSIKKMKIKNI